MPAIPRKILAGGTCLSLKISDSLRENSSSRKTSVLKKHEISKQLDLTIDNMN